MVGKIIIWCPTKKCLSSIPIERVDVSTIDGNAGGNTIEGNANIQTPHKMELFPC